MSERVGVPGQDCDNPVKDLLPKMPRNLFDHTSRVRKQKFQLEKVENWSGEQRTSKIGSKHRYVQGAVSVVQTQTEMPMVGRA